MSNSSNPVNTLLGSQGNTELTTVGSMLSTQDSLALVDLLKVIVPEQLASSDLYAKILNGTSDIREVAHLLNQFTDEINLATLNNATEASNVGSSSIPQTMLMNSENGLASNSILSLLEESSPAQTILTAYQNMQYNNNEIGSFLNSNARLNLLNSMESFALPGEIKEQIVSGDISTHDLLNLIQSKLNTASESTVHDLFSSSEYKSLVKEEVLSKWEFTPQTMTKENEIDRHFENLSNQLNELKGYLEQNTNSNSNGTVSSQANHLQENIDFMKNLNELFTYIQLPLKLKNQNANSELYVYTKKKAGRTAADGISVLLHLDMDHLGPLDVYIDLHHNNITSKFYLNQEDTIQLISTHMPQLEQALMKKGYTLNSEILNRNKDEDLLKDFIKQDEQTTSVSRYNFDIRA
jgi:hypothetical protein